MKKDLLLISIAETAYNVGYGAKLNFATFDIAEKVPGFLTFISFVVGIYALFIPALTNNQISAILIIFGIISLYLGMYQQDKQRHDEFGKVLTGMFYELKNLYLDAKSRPDNADFCDIDELHKKIQTTSVNMTVSKQVMFSDWYAHYKFFWQQQIGWIDEQLHFTFIRDKVPLSAWLVLGVLSIAGICYATNSFNILGCLTSFRVKT